MKGCPIWFSLAQAMILIVGILWTCNIVLAIMPPADQLSGAESYVAGVRARGEPISSENNRPSPPAPLPLDEGRFSLAAGEPTAHEELS